MPHNCSDWVWEDSLILKQTVVSSVSSMSRRSCVVKYLFLETMSQFMLSMSDEVEWVLNSCDNPFAFHLLSRRKRVKVLDGYATWLTFSCKITVFTDVKLFFQSTRGSVRVQSMCANDVMHPSYSCCRHGMTNPELQSSWREWSTEWRPRLKNSTPPSVLSVRESLR